MTRGLTMRLSRIAGYSVIELVGAVSVLSMVAVASLPSRDSGRERIDSMASKVVSDLRYARDQSIESGDHVAVEFFGDSYEVRRLVVSGDDWVLDRVLRTVELPDHLELDFDRRVDRIEFDARGVVISTDDRLWPTIRDGERGSVRLLSIFPSGQIGAYQQQARFTEQVR